MSAMLQRPAVASSHFVRVEDPANPDMLVPPSRLPAFLLIALGAKGAAHRPNRPKSLFQSQRPTRFMCGLTRCVARD